MKKYKKLTINIIVLTFILTGGIATPVFASSSRSNQKTEEKINLEIQLLETFEDSDYDAWKRYIGKNSNIAKYISKEEFNKFIQIRKLARNAQHDKALIMSEEFEQKLESKLKKSSIIQPKQTALPSLAQKTEKTIAQINNIKKEAEKNIS